MHKKCWNYCCLQIRYLYGNKIIKGFYDILINPSAHQYQLTIMKWLLVENMEAAIWRNITRAIWRNTKAHQSKGPDRFYFKGPCHFFHLEYVLIEISCPVEIDQNEWKICYLFPLTLKTPHGVISGNVTKTLIYEGVHNFNTASGQWKWAQCRRP